MAIADNAPEKSPFECAVLKHDIIFARSVDNNFYAAVVTDTNESNVAAEFLSGGRTNVSKTEIRPISPGCQVEVFVKADDEDEGDWQDATIVSFDAKAGTVSVNLDGKLDTTSIKYVRVGGEAFDWEIAPPSGLLDSSLFKFWLPVCIYLVLTYVYMQPMGLKVTVIVGYLLCLHLFLHLWARKKDGQREQFGVMESQLKQAQSRISELEDELTFLKGLELTKEHASKERSDSSN